MNKEVALVESVSDEAIGFLEMGSHAVGGDVEGADCLVVDPVLPLVAHAQHGCRGEHCMEGILPERIFFCLKSERSDAA